MKHAYVIIALCAFGITLHAQDATSIVKKADAKLKGEQSSYTEFTMQIVRPTWERTLTFKSWTKGTDLSLALVTSPAKEKGQAFLRHNREMWNWNPTINRMIKMPPSMLSQGWMGSDFTNDDLVNESSIVVDYTHTLVGNEIIDSRECFKIELTPHENAPVVWGKIILWISKKEYLQLKAEYYDEDEYLMKTERAFAIKETGGRIIPTRFEIQPADEPGNKTIITMNSVEFNQAYPNGFFSQQNMKKLR